MASAMALAGLYGLGCAWFGVDAAGCFLRMGVAFANGCLFLLPAAAFLRRVAALS
jgi:hypothetical protein